MKRKNLFVVVLCFLTFLSSLFFYENFTAVPLPQGCKQGETKTAVRFPLDCKNNKADGYFLFENNLVKECNVDNSPAWDSKFHIPLTLNFDLQNNVTNKFEVTFSKNRFSYECTPASDREKDLKRLLPQIIKPISEKIQEDAYLFKSKNLVSDDYDLITKLEANEEQLSYYYKCSHAKNGCYSSEISILDEKYEIYLKTSYYEEPTKLIGDTDHIILLIKNSYNFDHSGN